MEIENILNSLTIEQKVDLILGFDARLQNEERIEKEEIKNLMLKESAGMIVPVNENIKPYILADGPAGLRISPQQRDEKEHYTTRFPTANCLSSSFNIDLVKKVGKAIGEECIEEKVSCFLAPAMNIHRHPLAGRNYETYSEDPRLSGEIAGAYVDGVQSTGTSACIKHFIANNQETSRMFIDTIISERAFREIYLEGFRIAIEHNPLTLMTSYNKVNGKYCCENKELLNDILRKDLKYKGLIMTDWSAGIDPVKMILAGNDLIEPGSYDFYKKIMNAIVEGQLTEEDLNNNLRRIISFNLEMQRRLSEEKPKGTKEEHKKVALEAAEEGVVLLLI